jgi:hypothetical protein
MATVHLLVANDLVSHGKDPGAPLEKAESALRLMEKTGGEDVQIPLTRAKVRMLKARSSAKSAKRKEDVESLWAEAEAAFSAARKIGGGVWEVFATGAELSFWSARDARKSKGPASDKIRKGIALADEGLAISPNEPALLAWKGALWLLSSRVEDAPAAADAARQGRSLLDDALRRNPFLTREWKRTETHIDNE